MLRLMTVRQLVLVSLFLFFNLTFLFLKHYFLKNIFFYYFGMLRYFRLKNQSKYLPKNTAQ